ncbi:c-type cytochrome, partial [Pontibaca methylaminivorans]|uniref:c-type cytochrome n=1 Tax=Pontibaca methylaminivorans TaxID=515897 RepID=UPI003FA733BB
MNLEPAGRLRKMATPAAGYAKTTGQWRLLNQISRRQSRSMTIRVSMSRPLFSPGYSDGCCLSGIVPAENEEETMFKRSFIGVVALAALATPALAAGDADKGEKVFKKCQACHQVGDDAQNRVGPVLNDIIGRQAGT